MKHLLLIATLTLSGAPPALASWVHVTWMVNAETLWTITGPNTMFSGREGRLEGQGGPLEGYVKARANVLNSAQVAMNGTSYRYDLYQHMPPGVGEVELFKTVRIEAEVELRHGPSAASVTGVSKVRHKFDGAAWSALEVPVAVARTTSEQALGNIGFSVGGGSPNIGLSLTRGHGSFSTDGGGPLHEFVIACPVATYQSHVSTSLDLNAFAAGDLFQWWQTSARASGSGQPQLDQTLLTHPRCP